VNQLDIPGIVAKIKAAEAAVPGWIDKAIAVVTAAEGNMVGNFIVEHLGIADPKGSEDKLIAALQTVKAVLAQGEAFADPFLQFLLTLPVKPVSA
jgi:hypothetical protein